MQSRIKMHLCAKFSQQWLFLGKFALFAGLLPAVLRGSIGIYPSFRAFAMISAAHFEEMVVKARFDSADQTRYTTERAQMVENSAISG